MNQKLFALTSVRSVARCAAAVVCFVGALGSAWAQSDAVVVADAGVVTEKRSMVASREDDLQKLQALVVAAITPQVEERVAQSGHAGENWSRIVAGAASRTTLK
jgi:hypothetical protein